MIRRLSSRKTTAAEPAAVAARWEALRKEQPELAAGIDLHRTVQRLQRAANLAAKPPSLDPAQARDRMAAGIGLLQASLPFFDLDAAASLFRALARTAVGGGAKDDAASVVVACDRGDIDLDRVMRMACALDERSVGELLSPLGARAALASTLLRFSLAPVFRAAAEAYAELLTDAPWDRGVCSVCASEPLLAELRGGESRRVLRCGRCGAAWSFQRLRCPFCDTRDHRQLTVLHLPNEGDFLRVDACDACGGYLKALARLDPIRYELLPAEDLATAHLDLLSIERGYGRGRPAV